MSVRGSAFIAGAYEHPERAMPDKTSAQIHAEVAVGALRDAGLTLADVDGYFCSSDAPGWSGPVTMAEYLGIRPRYVDSTDTGGSAAIVHVGHAAAAIKAGKCSVALITLGERARSAWRAPRWNAPADPFEQTYGSTTVGEYALAARRHMYEHGTTSRQLAAIRVAAAHHAQYNPNAKLRKPVTIEEVLGSPLIADPLHRLDCCVVTDGGGAIVVVSPEVARDLPRGNVKVMGHGEAVKGTSNGRVDLTYTAAVWSGPRAFEEARVTPKDIDYASIYDSFTITVLIQLEDLGFCRRGGGGKFVEDGGLLAPHGRLPFNTDGGGLCNNHPDRGGMTKIIEAVRQLRSEANPEVQVPGCTLALAQGCGGTIGTRVGSATLILGQEDS
jgi:acetyl-CoA C-acetyltransferase